MPAKRPTRGAATSHVGLTKTDRRRIDIATKKSTTTVHQLEAPIRKVRHGIRALWLIVDGMENDGAGEKMEAAAVTFVADALEEAQIEMRRVFEELLKLRRDAKETQAGQPSQDEPPPRGGKPTLAAVDGELERPFDQVRSGHRPEPGMPPAIA